MNSMNNLNPKVRELIETVKKLINELETNTPSQSSIDPYAFEVADMTGYSGQEYGGFPEPIIKMEDEF